MCLLVPVFKSWSGGVGSNFKELRSSGEDLTFVGHAAFFYGKYIASNMETFVILCFHFNCKLSQVLFMFASGEVMLRLTALCLGETATI